MKSSLYIGMSRWQQLAGRISSVSAWSPVQALGATIADFLSFVCSSATILGVESWSILGCFHTDKTEW